MIVFAAIVSVMMACIKFDDRRSIRNYAMKLFAYMVGGVIAFGWLMHFL